MQYTYVHYTYIHIGTLLYLLHIIIFVILEFTYYITMYNQCDGKDTIIRVKRFISYFRNLKKKSNMTFTIF